MTLLLLVADIEGAERRDANNVFEADRETPV